MNVPGWQAYTGTLERLHARGQIPAAALADLVAAGKQLGVAAFDAGADAMHRAALEAVRWDGAPAPTAASQTRSAR